MASTNAAIRLQVTVERYKSTQARKLLKLVSALETAIMGAIPGQELREMPMSSVTRLLTMADQKMYVTTLPLMASYMQDLQDFVQHEAEIESRIWGAVKVPSASDLAQTFDIPLGIDGKDRGKSTSQFLQSWWTDARAATFGTVRRAAFERENNSQITQRIRGTRAAHFKDGSLELVRRNTITISNTAIQHLLSSTRSTVLKSTDAKGILWSALLERSVCARCRGLDHVPFGLDSGPRSPIHYGCRCIMIPVFKDTEIDSVESYYSWLKTQDEQFVVDVLGRDRGSVFLNGGMTAERFADLQLDKRFEPITLEDFKKLAPSAFTRAGV